MRYCILLLGLALLATGMTGCAGLPATGEAVEQQGVIIRSVEERRKRDFAHAPVKTVDGHFIGSGQRLMLSGESKLPKVFDREITIIEMNPMGIEDLAQMITQEFDIPVRLATRLGSQGSGSSGNSSHGGKTLFVDHQGNLKKLLDTIAAHFALSWEWDAKTGVIQFFKFKTKTFSVAANLGKVSINSSISNISDTGTSSETEEKSTSTQTTTGEQTTRLEASYTAFEEIKENVASMLSASGRVVFSQGSGTVTVTDYPSVLAEIEEFINQINSHLMRQVAINVTVYALRTSQDKDHSIQIDAIFENDYVNLVTAGANALPELTGLGSLTATILDPSELDGSTAVLKSLKKVGDVSLVTSGSAITLNNQPSPIQVVTEESYLAKVSTTNTADVGTLQELTPGKVTTGFSMLAIPHIIDSSTVILQYSISLSSLDSIDDISSGGQRIQVPTVSTRSVLQRVRMPLGSTLVLAGYENQADSFDEGVGLFGWSRRGGTDRELIVIAIEVNDFG